MFKFKIMPDDGETFDIDASMRDVVLWERTFKGRTLGMVSDAAKMSATILFELAYVACRRTRSAGVELLTFDQFLERFDIDTLEEPETDEDDEAVSAESDPTRAAVSIAQ